MLPIMNSREEMNSTMEEAVGMAGKITYELAKRERWLINRAIGGAFSY
jgi:hypothetical protein